jgi:hypothetical protein
MNKGDRASTPVFFPSIRCKTGYFCNPVQKTYSYRHDCILQLYYVETVGIASLQINHDKITFIPLLAVMTQYNNVINYNIRKISCALANFLDHPLNLSSEMAHLAVRFCTGTENFGR